MYMFGEHEDQNFNLPYFQNDFGLKCVTLDKLRYASLTFCTLLEFNYI